MSINLNKTKKPKTPRIIRKKPVGNETKELHIPSLNVINANVPLIVNTIDPLIENELMTYGYVALNSISIQNDKKIEVDRYIKALNKMGQKVYILIDTPHQHIVDADITLIESKKGNMIPLSLKLGVSQIGSLDVSAMAIECDKNGLCILKHVIDNDDDNLSLIESHFTFNNMSTDLVAIENYGCHLTFPIVKLSEIRANNQLVVEGTDIVTKKLRINMYQDTMQELSQMPEMIKELELSYMDFKNVIDANFIKIKDNLVQLEKYNQYYVENPPSDDVAIQKQSLIKHNMRLRNDYHVLLLCGMKRVAENKQNIENIIDQLHDLTEIYDKQLCSLNNAHHID